ncbi:MAG: hypothetical protein ACOWWH_11640 [Eubacteriaceae bacterium]
MITAYLVGIPAYQEGEDIEIRYSIYNDTEVLCKKTLYSDYTKPVAVGLKALISLLEELPAYDCDVFSIIINDAALNEIIRGSSTTKNGEVLKLASVAKRKISRFSKELKIHDISNNHNEILKWDKALKR